MAASWPLSWTPTEEGAIAATLRYGLWRADTGAVVTTFGQFSDYLAAVAWSPDSRTLAAVGKPVTTWDAQTGKLRAFRPDQQVWLSQWVSYRPDGKLLVEWEGGTVRAWQSGSADAAWKIHDNQGVGSIAWSPDSRRFATGTRTGVKLRDAATGALIQEFAGPKEYVSAMAWSPDGRTLVSGSWEGVIRLWDANTSATPRSLGAAPIPVESVAWSPDGKTIASGGRDHAVRLWSAESGAQLSRLEGHSGDVISLSWSPDGHALASGSGDLTAKVWDPATRRPLHTLAVGKTGVRDRPVYGQPNGVLVAWSVDGRSLATTGDDDRQVKLWDPSSGRLERKIETPNSSISALSWSPDNRLLAAACGSIDFWDRATGDIFHSDPLSHLVSRSLAFRPRGSTIANLESHGAWEMLSVTSEPGAVKLTRANRSSYPSDTRAAAWSPDGRLLATAHDDGSIQLWDGDTGAALRNLSGHAGYVLSLAWSPDSRKLVSGGTDGTLRIHDAASGQTESITTLLPEGEWITVLPRSHYYSSSPHGDETAKIRFAGRLRELVPLSLYRSELQREAVRKLLGAPAPPVRPNFLFYAKITAASLWAGALRR